MALPVTISGISTAVACVGPFANNIEINFAPNTNVATGFSGNTHVLGIPFIAASSNAITDIGIYLAKVTSPTDDLTATLYAADGSNVPTGSALATATIPNGAMSTVDLSYYKIVFATAATVSSGSRYILVLARTGAISGTTYFNIGVSTIAGAAETVMQNNGSWTTHPSLYEACLTVGTTASTYYFFGRDGTTATTLQAFKSSAPDTSWASAATKTGFTTAILNIAGYQLADVIHLLVQDGTMSSSVATKYVNYDMATDTFLASTETVLAASALTGQATAGWGGSLVARANGEVVAFYNSTATNTSGTPRARVSYRRRTALNTWQTAVRVDGNTALDNTQPNSAVVNLSNDTVHFHWFSNSGIQQRALTSANALQTASVAIGPATVFGGAVCYDSAGTNKGVVVWQNGATRDNVGYYDSGNTPTFGASINLDTSSRSPIRIFNDNTDLYVLFGFATDSDLYVEKSTSTPPSFGTKISAFVGTVSDSHINLSRDAVIYQRGSNVVIPYVVNDNGTLKYNEYTVRTLSVSYTLTALTGATVLAGQAAILACSRDLDAATGAITVAGQAAGLNRGYVLTATTGAVNLTGNAVNLTASTAQRLTALIGAITLAGQPVGLKVGRVVTALTGATTLTGIAAGLGRGYTLFGVQRAITVTGIAPMLRFGRVVIGATRATTVTGNNAELTVTTASRTLTALTGTVTLAGQSVGLRRAYTLTATTRAITVTGQAAILRYGRVVRAVAGAVTLAGQSAILRYGRVVRATTGAIALAGQSAILRYGHVLAAIKGAVTLAGTATALKYGRVLVAVKGAITVTGNAAFLNKSAAGTLIALPGAITVTGNAAILRRTTAYRLTALTGAVAIGGQTATLRRGYVLTATKGAVVLTGYPVNLDTGITYRLVAETGEFSAAGHDVLLVHSRRLRLEALSCAIMVRGTEAYLSSSAPFYPVSMASLKNRTFIRPWRHLW